MAEFFTSSYSSERSTYDPNLLCTGPISHKVQSILQFKSVTAGQLVHAVKKLKPTRGPGPDKVPPFVVKGVFETIQAPLLYLFNLIITSCIFPSAWKKANIIPVPKKGNNGEITNQRPVSLLNAFSKLFEIVLHTIIQPHLMSLLSDTQHGFTPKRSTVTNLLTFTHEVSEALDQGHQVHCIYTDFEKAFDRVSHDLLISDLWFNGFSYELIKFWCSYFSGRTQQVYFNGVYSSEYSATSGVAQGGNLGPDCFLYKINSIDSVILYSSRKKFADDFKLYRIIKEVEDCELLQRDLTSVVDWSNENKLKFCYNKCVVMKFYKGKNYIDFQYSMGEQALQEVLLFKDLGVWFNRNLTFEDHCTKILRDAYRLLGFIKRNSRYFSHETVQTLYNALIRPKLEYCSIIWSPYQLVHIKPFETFQHKLLRYLYFKKFKNIAPVDTSTTILLEEFQMMRLCTRRFLARILFIHKVIKNLINDSTILPLLSFKVPSTRTRQQTGDVFTVPRSRTVRHENSPVLSLMTAWNQFARLVPNLDFTMKESDIRRAIEDNGSRCTHCIEI